MRLAYAFLGLAYACLGIGFFGGYRTWSLAVKFAYAGLFPLHWFSYQAYGHRRLWLPFVEEHLWWIPLAIKLFVFYAIYKLWIGDWPGEFFGEP